MQWGQLMLERTDSPDDVVHYRLSGGLNYGEAGSEFVEAIKRDLEAGHRAFVLNLADLERMDSGGLGLLASAYMAVHNARGSMALDGVPERYRKLLKAVGLSAAFGMEPDTE